MRGHRGRPGLYAEGFGAVNPDQLKIAGGLLALLGACGFGYLIGRAHDAIARKRRWKQRWKGSPWA